MTRPYNIRPCHLLDVSGSRTLESLPILISRNRRNRLCIFNFLYKDVDFVFICLNIIRSMIREEFYYQIDLSFERNRLSESKFANYDRRSF